MATDPTAPSAPSIDASAAKRALLQERFEKRRQNRTKRGAAVTSASLAGPGKLLRQKLVSAIMNTSGDMVEALALLIAEFTGCNVNEIVWCKTMGSWRARTGGYYSWCVAVVTGVYFNSPDGPVKCPVCDVMTETPKKMHDHIIAEKRKSVRGAAHDASGAPGGTRDKNMCDRHKYIDANSPFWDTVYEVSMLGRRYNPQVEAGKIRYFRDMAPKELDVGDQIEVWDRQPGGGTGYTDRRKTGSVVRVDWDHDEVEITSTPERFRWDPRTTEVSQTFGLGQVSRNLSHNMDMRSYIFYRILADPRVGLLDANERFVKQSILNLCITDVLPNASTGPGGLGFVKIEDTIDLGVQNFLRKKASLVRKALHSKFARTGV